MNYKYLDSLSEDEFVECVHIERGIKNPNYFKIDETLNDSVTNFEKKF